MKTVSLLLTAVLFLFFAASADAQERKRTKPGNKITSAPVPPQQDQRRQHSPPVFAHSVPLPREAENDAPPAAITGIGICLIGDQYIYFSDPETADKCDAVMWSDALPWAANQRLLLDQSAIAGDENLNDDGSTSCRNCSGTCQTISLPIKDTSYVDVEAEGGLRPSECLERVRAICESGSFRHFAGARCGN